MKPFSLVALVVLSTLAVAAESTLSGVVIAVEPPQVVRRTFDPGNPPPEMPKLTPPEVGTCVYSFGCSTEIVMRGVRGRPARVTGVQVATRLSITLWTPQQGPPKILAHEEGHREIAERYYQLAQPVARRLAEQALGKPVGASVGDRRGSELKLKEIQDALIADYLRATARRCDLAQTSFDSLTDHSISPMPETEAVARAIAEEETQFAQLPASRGRRMAAEPADAAVRRRPTRPSSGTGFP